MIEYKNGSVIAKHEVTMLSAIKNDENLKKIFQKFLQKFSKTFSKKIFKKYLPVNFVRYFPLQKRPLNHKS